MAPPRIVFEKLGDITSAILWRQSNLDTALGPDASASILAVRDLGLERAVFIPGQRVTLDRGPGSDVIWTGYLWKTNRRFWFDVDRPDTLQRMWILTLVDLPILFGRRVTYKQSDPDNVHGPKYTTQTYDDDAIATLIEDYLDLSFDDLDTSSGVQQVGYINYGETTYPYNAGATWGEAMTAIAQLPAAAFGLTPSRKLIYVDVDDENAPFALSDTPGTGQRGYRECLITFDGTQLANDFFAWGAGKGNDSMVFAREQDSSSQSVHGLWQDSFTSYNIWKQATINKVADRAVDGSPGSRRGRKDDRVEVKCVTYADGLTIGDRVRFISNIWGFDDVLPVRRMRMTFPTPTDIQYELRLSHEIDRWGFEDPQPPNEKAKTTPRTGTPETEDPEECDCSITDIPDRVVFGGWGQSTSGLVWDGSGDNAFIEDGVASMDFDVGQMSLPVVLDKDGSVTTTFQFKYAPAEVGGNAGISVYFDGPGAQYGIEISHDGDDPEDSQIGATGQGGDHPSGKPEQLDFNIPPNEWWNCKFEWHGINVQAKFWLVGDPEPDWQVATGDDDPPTHTGPSDGFFMTLDGYDATLWWRTLDIEGVNRCIQTGSFQDDLNRVEASGWGTGWTETVPGGNATSVDGSAGLLSAVATTLPALPTPPGSHLCYEQFWYPFAGQGIVRGSPWWIFETKFKISHVATGAAGDKPLTLTMAISNTQANGGFMRISSSSTIDDTVANGLFCDEPKTDWVADEWYIYQLVVTPTSATNRIWLESAGEGTAMEVPDAATVDDLPSYLHGVGQRVSCGFFWTQTAAARTNQAVVATFDYMSLVSTDEGVCFIGDSCSYDLDLHRRAFAETLTDPPLGESYAHGIPVAWLSGAGDLEAPGDDGSSTGHTEDGNYISEEFTASDGDTIRVTTDIDGFDIYAVSATGDVEYLGTRPGTFSTQISNTATTWRIEAYSSGSYNSGLTGGGTWEVRALSDVFDPDELDDYGGKAFALWFRLELTETMDLVFDVYGSGMQDTVLLVYDDPVSTSSVAIFSNDDTDEDVDNTSWSCINDDGSSNNLPPGIYWIAVAPLSGENWNRAEGDVLVRITRLLTVGNAPLPRGDPCSDEPVDADEGGPAIGSSGEEVAQRGTSTLYSRHPYQPKTLQVWVDGRIQRWGIDFTESDPESGEFTFAVGKDESAVVLTVATAA